uniref:NAB domain-containing protein n=1 Tax=Setaria digitata TaxID=48799 RepID=A0A915Q4N4_9BILA
MDAVAGPKLPNMADLKDRLRSEPQYYQVLENYLHNAAQIINGLRARLEACEGQERMDEEPIRKVGSAFQLATHEPLLSEESGNAAAPKVQGSASERERVEEVREIVLYVSFIFNFLFHVKVPEELKEISLHYYDYHCKLILLTLKTIIIIIIINYPYREILL